MKKLARIAAILIVLALLFFGADRVSAQPTWGSYSDPEYAVPSDIFTEPQCTVYMYGTDFTKNTDFKIIYWDGGGYKRVAEVQRRDQISYLRASIPLVRLMCRVIGTAPSIPLTPMTRHHMTLRM